jgi:hypothetical protein
MDNITNDEVEKLLITTVKDMTDSNEAFVKKVLKEFSSTVDNLLKIGLQGAQAPSGGGTGDSRLLAAAMIMAFKNTSPTVAVEKVKELETLLNEQE